MNGGGGTLDFAENLHSMATEAIYRCDWRDCECHARTLGAPPTTFIAVGEDAGRTTHHFCSWDCLLMFAGEMRPAEVIPIDEVS
jgi:hypothetical protein